MNNGEGKVEPIEGEDEPLLSDDALAEDLELDEEAVPLEKIPI